jgi:uncharacterized membrane protein (UPF0127 family)
LETDGVLTFRIVDICDEPSSRARGLQFRHIEPDECCVFLFENPQGLSFWGKNTEQPLYLNAVSEGECLESLYLEENSLEPKTTEGDYVIGVETDGSRCLLGAHIGFYGNIVRAW